MLNKIKKIKLKNIYELIIILIAFIPGMILRLIKKDLWIVAENGDDAKDNGYVFFEYMMKSNKKKDVYYILKKDNIYYEKLKKYHKNIILQNSIKHNIYTIAASKYISSQIGSGLPFPQIVFNLQGTFLYRFESIFLQHGITQNKVQCLLPNESKVDLFCCAGNEEYDFIINGLGYEEEKVKKTGFCRYDCLEDKSTNSNKILIMFTWRKQFENSSKEEFLQSEYYKNIEGLLENKKLIDFAERNNFEICICLHDNMKKYKEQFKSNIKNIKIVDKTEKSIQELLCESKYLITDYSSVAFDFAYMKKPLQYFQFDYEDFRKKHLEEGYWKYSEGFGKVTNNLEECVDELINSYTNGFIMEEQYASKIEEFFIFQDEKNCERTYKEILNMPKNKEKNNIDSYWTINMLLFVIGILLSEPYLLLSTAVLGAILNIIYSCKEIRKKIYILIMNISLFTFLIAKPVISTIKGMDWINRFGITSNVHALIFIVISLFCLYIGARFAEKDKRTKKILDDKKKEVKNFKYVNKEKVKLFSNISFILFLVCAIFSIITEYDKLIYMHGKEYVEYYLTYENSFSPIITLLAGMTNIFLCIFLATMPPKEKAIIPMSIFIIYNMPTFIIGQRTPLVIAILFILAYFVIRDYLDNTQKWIGKFEKIALMVSVPICIVILAVFNYTRVDEELPTYNVLGLFSDFFYSQGVSYDVLNIGYQKKEEIKEISNNNYTFGPFIDYFKYSTIAQILFNTEDLPTGNNSTKALESHSYSHILSYLSRDDYLEGHGWGSSFILETYTDFGYLGIIIYCIVLGYILARIPELLRKNIFLSSIILICTLNIFIVPRAEALQFLQFIVTPQFWGAWIGCIAIFKIMQILETNKLIKRKKYENNKIG